LRIRQADGGEGAWSRILHPFVVLFGRHEAPNLEGDGCCLENPLHHARADAQLPADLEYPVATGLQFENARDAVKTLIVANEFLEAQVRELQAAVSHGYARGKFEFVRDRKDWYD